MFQNICIFGCFISSVLLFNIYWKNSCIPNTTDNYIEPSVVAGILIGGLSFILHVCFLPDEYQDSYYLINPYIIIGYTTVIYHSIRRYLEIVKKTDGNSKHAILWGLQIIDPIFVNYVCIRGVLAEIIYYVSSTEYIFNNLANIVYIIVFGYLYYCKYRREYYLNISYLSVLGFIYFSMYEVIYINEWYLRYNVSILSAIYIGLVCEWNNNCIMNKKIHRGNTYPVLSMYISDIVCAIIMYRGNYNYLRYLHTRTF